MLQAKKLHHVDDEWDAIQAAGVESPRAALADQFAGAAAQPVRAACWGRACAGPVVVDDSGPNKHSAASGKKECRPCTQLAATPSCLTDPSCSPAASLPPSAPAAMRADSSALSRQQTSGPAYLEFPLFY